MTHMSIHGYFPESLDGGHLPSSRMPYGGDGQRPRSHGGAQHARRNKEASWTPSRRTHARAMRRRRARDKMIVCVHKAYASLRSHHSWGGRTPGAGEHHFRGNVAPDRCYSSDPLPGGSLANPEVAHPRDGHPDLVRMNPFTAARDSPRSVTSDLDTEQASWPLATASPLRPEAPEFQPRVRFDDEIEVRHVPCFPLLREAMPVPRYPPGELAVHPDTHEAGCDDHDLFTRLPARHEASECLSSDSSDASSECAEPQVPAGHIAVPTAQILGLILNAVDHIYKSTQEMQVTLADLQFPAPREEPDHVPQDDSQRSEVGHPTAPPPLPSGADSQNAHPRDGHPITFRMNPLTKTAHDEASKSMKNLSFPAVRAGTNLETPILLQAAIAAIHTIAGDDPELDVLADDHESPSVAQCRGHPHSVNVIEARDAPAEPELPLPVVAASVLEPSMAEHDDCHESYAYINACIKALDPHDFNVAELELRDLLTTFFATWGKPTLATLPDLLSDEDMTAIADAIAEIFPDFGELELCDCAVPLTAWIEHRMGGEIDINPETEVLEVTALYKQYIKQKITLLRAEDSSDS